MSRFTGFFEKSILKNMWKMGKFRMGSDAIEYSQKWTQFLFQNDVALYFEPYWKQGNAADINVFVVH